MRTNDAGARLTCTMLDRSGDFRFRASYSKHNPRKMVKVWAEKERRNLVRLQASGIRSPQPLQLRSHVLVMDFIGTDGVAAPRLKVRIYLDSLYLSMMQPQDSTSFPVPLNKSGLKYQSSSLLV